MTTYSNNIEVELAVKKANSVKSFWKEIGIQKRLIYLKKVYSIFNVRKQEIAETITKETGKPISQTLSEVDFFQKFNRWQLDNSPKILADKITFEDDKTIHKLTYEPIGTIAVIIPWNSPFGLFSWKFFSNLIVGNVIVVKSAEETVETGKLIEKIVNSCDLPEGVFSQVYGGAKIGEILTDQKIDMISFTGSSNVGKNIYKKAGKKFVRSITELGGSNPSIIFEDANIDIVVERIFWGRFSNNGQNCDAVKRVIVHKFRYEEFISKLIEILKTKKIGDPIDRETYFGTLVSKKQLETAQNQFRDAVDRGAEVLFQLPVPKDLKGNYLPPTILTKINNDMTVWKEEVFAPILPIVTFETEDQAIELANNTNFGLGATIFTKNKERFIRVSKQIMAGNIEMNNIIQWIPENPFGGYKDSGIGRENGVVGLLELCQIKTISIEK